MVIVIRKEKWFIFIGCFFLGKGFIIFLLIEAAGVFFDFFLDRVEVRGEK